MPGKKFTEDGKIHLANLKALEDFAQAIYTQLIPVGGMIPYGGTQAPTGWLMCNGSAVSRTTYVGLFTVVGTTYGAGDGSTTFNLPNFQAASASLMLTPIGAGVGVNIGSTNNLSSAAGTVLKGVAVNFIIRSG